MTMPLLIGLLPQLYFWQNTTFCPSHTLPTPLTLFHATSSCSRNWRKQWKVADSMTLKWFKPMRQDKWGLLQKVTTSGAFVIGGNAGISAYRHTLLWRRQYQLAVKSTLSLTKKAVPKLNDQSTYKQFTNVAAVRRLKTHGVEHHGGHSFSCFCTIQKTVATVSVCP